MIGPDQMTRAAWQANRQPWWKKLLNKWGGQ